MLIGMKIDVGDLRKIEFGLRGVEIPIRDIFRAGILVPGKLLGPADKTVTVYDVFNELV